MKKRKEEGQAMIEFALVLPIFLLLVMGILDFGFLFYNYISLENSARNAARVACVEYEDIAFDSVNAHSYVSPRKLTLPSENATQLSAYDGLSAGEVPYSVSEKNICVEVARAIEHTGIDKENVVVSIDYSYDTSESASNNGWNIQNRPKGDATITVKAKAHVLTPVLGVTADHMMKDLTSTSTFKVEQQVEEATTN
ncbi:MAG: pilus assembly protein [Eubacterium sp.]|nr:pilus assembly protein [Eubacterium sp.]MBR2278307.1 pilus assembly protein [Eubacterium sp.]